VADAINQPCDKRHIQALFVPRFVHGRLLIAELAAIQQPMQW
jgi:hypothetical protein